MGFDPPDQQQDDGAKDGGEKKRLPGARLVDSIRKSTGGGGGGGWGGGGGEGDGESEGKFFGAKSRPAGGVKPAAEAAQRRTKGIFADYEV